MSTAPDTLIDKLRAFAANPVEWCLDERMCDPVDFFDWLWGETYSKYEADRESDWIEDPYDPRWEEPDDVNDVDDIRCALANFSARHPQARVDYLDVTRRFWMLRAVTPTDHSKHYPRGGMTQDALLKASRSGKSLLNPGIGPGQLLDMYWVLLVQLCTYAYPSMHDSFAECTQFRAKLRHTLLSSGTLRLAMNAQMPVGATNGELSHWLCFELEPSTPLVHAYPISSKEADEIRVGLPILIVNDFNGYLDFGQRSYDQKAFGSVRRS